MPSCSLCHKKVQKGNGPSFCVPKDLCKRENWNKICKMTFTPNARICIDHFAPHDVITAGRRWMLMPNAVPIVKHQPYAVVTSPREKEPNCELCGKKCKPNTGSYFRMPEDEYRRTLWRESCRMQLSPNSVICEDHFPKNSFIRFRNQITLLPNAVPLPPCLSEAQIQANIASKETVIDDDNRSEISVNVPISSSCLQLEDPLNLNTDSYMEQVEEVCHQYADKEIQTDPIYTGFEKYAQKCRQLETEIKELKLQLSRSNLAMNTIYKIFTEGQIRKLMSPAGINWRDYDMENALQLYKCGSRAYKYLYKKGFPLPHISSLQRWKRKRKNENQISSNKSSALPSESNDQEEANDFSGDDNDWFDDFFEEESVNNDNSSDENGENNKPESEIYDTSPQQETSQAIIKEPHKDDNKGIPDTNANILRPHLSKDLNAIISSSENKVFLAKIPQEIDKSQKQNSIYYDQTQSRFTSVEEGATSISKQPDMPDLSCITTAENINETIPGVADKPASNEKPNVIIIRNQSEPMDYKEFLKSIRSGSFLVDET